MKRGQSVSRRDVLRVAGGGVASTLLLSPDDANGQATASPVQHVVLVLFGGGVSFQDAFPPFDRQTKKFQSNHPRTRWTLFRLLNEGTGIRLASPMIGHYSAFSSILTGIVERPGFKAGERPRNPTIVEYVRKQHNLDAGLAWLCVGGEGEEQLLSYSTHPDYGARYAPNVIHAGGLFGEFQQMLGKFSKPGPLSDGESSVLDRLRGAVRLGSPEAEASLFGNTPETRQRFQKWITEALAADKPQIRGPAAADTLALRTAAEIFKTFQPALLTVVLTAADIGHVSNRQYLDVIESNDRELGELVKVIDSNPNTKASTTIFVLPDFGRDSSLNAFGGKDHSSNSLEVNGSWIIARGAAIAPHSEPESAVRTIDVCPTVCALLRSRTELAQGRIVTEILAG